MSLTSQTPRTKATQDSLTELFCDIDDFCQQFVPDWERQQLASQERQRRRAGGANKPVSALLMPLSWWYAIHAASRATKCSKR